MFFTLMKRSAVQILPTQLVFPGQYKKEWQPEGTDFIFDA